MESFIDVNISRMVEHLEQNTDNTRYSDVLHFGTDLLMVKNTKSHNMILEYPIRIDALAIVRPRKGFIKLNLDIKDYQAGESSIVFLTPQRICSNFDLSNSESDVVFIDKDFIASKGTDVSFKEIVPVILNMLDNPVVQMTPSAVQAIDSLFDILYEFLQDDFEYKRVAISSILITMVSRVISEMSRKIKEPSSPSAQRSRKDIYFKEFMMLVAEHYKKERSVGFYANKMFITPKYLSGIIKDVSGKSAAEWIDHYVVMEAKNLIKYSGLNIQEVAYALNFPNQSFFGKFFKRLSGMSPSEYKNL